MKLDYEMCAAAAARYANKRDFRRDCDREYQWLQRNGLFQKAANHMEPLRRTMCDDEVHAAAKKYTTRRAFKIADQAAYMTAHRRGIIESVCAHMEVRYRNNTNEQLTDIALKFKSRSEFVSCDNGAYQAAIKRGILDKVCAHMPAGDRRLGDDELLAIAKRYETRMDCKIGDFGAYTTIIRRGLTRSAFAHMRHGNLCFREDKPAVVYQFRLDLPCGMVLYKVGISNRDPLQRLKSMEVRTDITVELINSINYEFGRDARVVEKRLHRKFASHRYSGEPVMKNGNTELFMVPLITV